MNSGRTVFAQLLGLVPFAHFEHLVDKYQANRWTRDFTAWSHFICMAYAPWPATVVARLWQQSPKFLEQATGVLHERSPQRSHEIAEFFFPCRYQFSLLIGRFFQIRWGIASPPY
jgi:hypothetical protein